MTPPFRLTESERASPLWQRLKAHFLSDQQIALAKVGRDIGMAEQQTAAYRGQIRYLDGLIALGDARPPTGD